MSVPTTQHEILVWQLETVRALIERTADRVSLAFFVWSRPPGNGYVTFYPTAWLPSADDEKGRTDETIGHRIFRGTMSPADGPHPVHLGTYGDGALWIPNWSQARSRRKTAVVRPERDRVPARAAAKLEKALDIDWLANEGGVDRATSDVVLRWLDEVIATARRFQSEAFSMGFDWNPQPLELWRIALQDRDKSRVVVWPDRHAVIGG